MMQSPLFFDKIFSRIDKVELARLKVHLDASHANFSANVEQFLFAHVLSIE